MKKNNDTKDYSEHGISEQSTLSCEQKNVIQSSDFPVRRTDSYRHKKAPIFLPYKIQVKVIVIAGFNAL